MIRSDADRPPAWLAAIAVVAPLLVFLAVYVPAAGLGFISDDFRWIRESRLTGASDALALFEQDNGFYRPLVALTFGVNHALAGTHPRLYGATNLALALLCGGLLVQLGRRIGLGTGPSLLAAGVWLLNFHGINMALLWTSGRTALLVTACALAAALATLTRRPVLAVLFVALALLSKEEAVILPAVLVGWLLVLGEHRTVEGRRRLVVFGLGLAIALCSYGWLRSRTAAMIPSTAPSYYRLTTDPLTVGRNLVEYADRSLTYAAATIVIAALLLKSRRTKFALRRSTAYAAAIWYVGAYAITTFVPVRSSLYAVLPSVAGALVAAELCGSLWTQASAARRRNALGAVIIVPLLCLPAYLARNHRWTDLARFSEQTLDELTGYVEALPADSTIVVIDDPTKRINVQSAFGSMLADALYLRLNRPVAIALQRSPGDAPLQPSCAGCPRTTFLLEQGHLRPAAR